MTEDTPTFPRHRLNARLRQATRSAGPDPGVKGIQRGAVHGPRPGAGHKTLIRILVVARPVKVVIAGAGFAAIRTAKALEGKADVIIVSPGDRFVYLPLIHEMVSERQLPRDVTKPLREICPNATHVHDRAVAVDGNHLVLASGDKLPFDKLVVAIGAEPNDFGLPGVREHTFSFYSVKDALLANAALKTAAVDVAGRPIRVAVIGASFTGVEVAGEAAELLNRLDFRHEITLLDAGELIFPHQDDAFRDGVHQGIERLGMTVRPNVRITGVEAGKVLIGDETVKADVIFWCAGAKPRRIDGVDSAVRATLQSGDRDDIFVLGDAADFPRAWAVPKLAQTCLLYTSPSPRDGLLSRMPSSA